MIVNIIKVGRLRWIGHLMRMEEDNATRRLTLLRPDGGRRRGRPKLRWMDGIEEGTWCSWMEKEALDREAWRNALTAARAHKGL